MTVYVQIFCRQQLPAGDWPLPRPEHWFPWVNTAPSEEGLVTAMAAHRFMRTTGYMNRNSESPEVVNVRVYHALDSDQWNEAGDQPLACRYSDFTFRRDDGGDSPLRSATPPAEQSLHA